MLNLHNKIFIINILFISLVSHHSWVLCLILFPATTFFNLFEWNRRFLVCCKISNPNIWINIIATICHAIWLYAFVFILDFSVLGVGISTFITYFLSFILLEISTLRFSERVHQSKWIMLNRDMLSELKPFWKMSLPCWGIIMIYWYPVEIVTFFSGLFGVHELSAMTILNSMKSLAEEAFYGFGLASLAHVGNSLGDIFNWQNRIWMIKLIYCTSTLYITYIYLCFIDAHSNTVFDAVQSLLV